MQSLYESVADIGNIFQKKTNISYSNFNFNGIAIIYAILFAFFVLIVVMMLMGKKINWSIFDPRPKTMQIIQSAYLFWKPNSQIFTNLEIPNNAIRDFISSEYTTQIDMILYNTRAFNSTDDGPWRHIYHRGSNELKSTTAAGRILSPCSSTNTGSLPDFGLPKHMNPGVFLDPNTNDIIIFIDTAQGSETYRESVRISDIPMDIPFRLGITINKRVLEVYLNCKLEVTKILSGEPKRVENVWYGLAGSAAAQAQIQNFYIWKNPILAHDLSNLCKSLPSFAVKRPICDVAGTIITNNSSSSSLSTPSPSAISNVSFNSNTCGGV